MNGEARDYFRILVADDEEAILHTYAMIFEDMCGRREDDLAALGDELFGDQVVADKPPRLDCVLCRQGEEAVVAAERAREEANPFAVAFIDMRMPPGPSGAVVAGEIRTTDRDVNIVIVTGYSDTDIRSIARKVPPAENLFYLAKPFHPSELQQLASALTSKWQADRRLREAHRRLQQDHAELQAAGARTPAGLIVP